MLRGHKNVLHMLDIQSMSNLILYLLHLAMVNAIIKKWSVTSFKVKDVA